MTDAVIFDPLPPRKANGAGLSPQRLAQFAALKARPGEWARIPEKTGQGLTRTFKRHGFETTTRTMDGSQTLWARWPVENKEA